MRIGIFKVRIEHFKVRIELLKARIECPKTSIAPQKSALPHMYISQFYKQIWDSFRNQLHVSVALTHVL